MRRFQISSKQNLRSTWDAVRCFVEDFRSSFASRLLSHTHNKETLICPRVDIYTTPDEVIVQASMPGVAVEDVEITWIEGELTICGKTKPHLKKVTYVKRERLRGTFARTLTLDIPVDANKATATLDNGILFLILPRVRNEQSLSMHIAPKSG